MNKEIDIEQTMFDLLYENKDPIKIKEEKYYYNGIPVPRVTEIISKMISEEYLLYWANGLGFKHQGYKKTVDAAANIGSESHDLISRFLKGEIFTSTNIPYLGFRKWWLDISSNNIVKVIGSEVSLTCPYFGGTYDLLVQINDLVYLVDFKTSNHVSYKYYLQLAAYKYMLEQEGYTISGCIILQLDKKEISYTEYPLIFSNPYHLDFINKCSNTFLSLVYGYYNIYQCEKMYNNIF